MIRGAGEGFNQHSNRNEGTIVSMHIIIGTAEASAVNGAPPVYLLPIQVLWVPLVGVVGVDDDGKLISFQARHVLV